MNKKLVKWLFVVLWASIIFFQSDKNGVDSGSLSLSIALFIKAKLYFVLGNFDLETMHFLVRKTAHFTEYTILGFLILNALDTANSFKKYAISIFAGIIYAVTDEYHQSYIPGRVPAVFDVFVDIAGVIFGVLVRGYLAIKSRILEC